MSIATHTHSPDDTVASRFAWLPADRLLLPALALLTLLLGIFEADFRLFWSDELATVHIAEAPTWAAMLLRSRTADLNPPLEPTLVRLSCQLLGYHELAARLPAILGFTVALVCLYLLLRRRLAPAWALFGALLPLASFDISFYLVDARPYPLLIGSLGVAAVAYERICYGEARGAPTRIVLALACACLLLSHIFGSYAMAGFLLAEAVRTVRRRTVDLGTWAALLLPLLCCVTYLPLIRSQHSDTPLVYQDSSRTSIPRGLKVYYEFLITPVSGLLKVAFLLIFFLPFAPRLRFPRFLSPLPEIWVLLLCLLATPLIVTVMFHIRAPFSAFYPRYSLALIYPEYLLVVGLLGWRAGNHRLVGLGLAALAVLAVLYNFRPMLPRIPAELHHGLLNAPAGATSDGGVSLLRPDLPLAVDNAFRFMEAGFQLPAADTARMVYVTSKPEAMRISHQNAREAIGDMVRGFQLPLQVVPLEPFLTAHRQFLLLTLPGNHDWFWQDLAQHHAGMQLLAKPQFSGKSQELWLVDLPPGFTLP